MKTNKFLKLFLVIFTITNFNTLFGAFCDRLPGVDPKEYVQLMKLKVYIAENPTDQQPYAAFDIEVEKGNTVSHIKKLIQDKINQKKYPLGCYYSWEIIENK